MKTFPLTRSTVGEHDIIFIRDIAGYLKGDIVYLGTHGDPFNDHGFIFLADGDRYHMAINVSAVMNVEDFLETLCVYYVDVDKRDEVYIA